VREVQARHGQPLHLTSPFTAVLDVLGGRTVHGKMSGLIFISYRREDDQNAAGRLYDRLVARFPKEQLFFDVDNIDPGVDFLEAIEASVGSCGVLIAVIGKRWLGSSDEAGK
jgi:TIR domain